MRRSASRTTRDGVQPRLRTSRARSRRLAASSLACTVNLIIENVYKTQLYYYSTTLQLNTFPNNPFFFATTTGPGIDSRKNRISFSPLFACRIRTL